MEGRTDGPRERMGRGAGRASGGAGCSERVWGGREGEREGGREGGREEMGERRGKAYRLLSFRVRVECLVLSVFG